ncbi:MAG: NAD(P)/FAD-dependent oxidoreductase [Ignavibacteriales bacterium]|nr:NAD(P)/FAD-dependent oxidoreductase [Ignavibacteriales bacterium]
MNDVEVTIIGAGVVGLAIASRLSQKSSRVAVLEKNEKYGMETSSRNSEVIHAGIYYPPDSLKAKLCVEGKNELYSICLENNIAHKQITKIIIATSESEIPTLELLYHNGMANGVELQMLDAKETNKLEPDITAVASIFSPSTGIISVHGLMDYFFHSIKNNGATLQHNCEVVGIEKISSGYKIFVKENGNRSSFTSEKIINAAGLFSDRIAGMAGIDIDGAKYRLTYCKGSYFAVTPSKSKLISRLVYPVPLVETLGVHALLDLGGRLKFGPDLEYLSKNTIGYTVDEKKRSDFSKAIQRMIPSITEDDIYPDMSGIRPKLQKMGEPQRDFVIVHEKERGLEGFINLIGIESPGLSSSPAIARYVEKMIF